MIEVLTKRLGFTQEDSQYLTDCHEKMTKNAELRGLLAESADRFFCTDDRSYETGLELIAQKTGLHRYTVDLVFLLICARPMKYLYHVNGIPENIFYDTLSDLCTKTEECKRVYGVCGMFVSWWYPKFYTCRRLTLGRLQYERFAFPFDGYRDFLKKGDTVYKCHIPSKGSLSPDTVIDSLHRAYAFFEKELKNGILPVYCHSWLFYPPMAEAVYANGSNLRSFYQAFDVVEVEEDLENANFWRVFDMEYSPENLANAPENTSLQRAMKRFLLDGGHMGNGTGILLFDGEKILDSQS